MLDGYKTWIGAGIMAIAAALTYLGNPELGKALEQETGEEKEESAEEYALRVNPKLKAKYGKTSS